MSMLTLFVGDTECGGFEEATERPLDGPCTFLIPVVPLEMMSIFLRLNRPRRA